MAGRARRCPAYYLLLTTYCLLLTAYYLLLTTYYLLLPWQAAHDAVREEKLLLARQAFGLMDTSGDGELSRSEVRYLVITPVELLQQHGSK